MPVGFCPVEGIPFEDLFRQEVPCGLFPPPVRHVGFPAALELRLVVSRAGLVVRPLGPGGVGGLPGHPLRAGLLRSAAQGRALSPNLLAVRGLHPGLRHHAPDGRSPVLVAGLPTVRTRHAAHSHHLLGHRYCPYPHRAPGPGHAHPPGIGAGDCRAQASRRGPPPGQRASAPGSARLEHRHLGDRHAGRHRPERPGGLHQRLGAAGS